MNRSCNTQNVQNGFTLIEILVTLIVVLVGLLGIAALQVKSQKAQIESYQRSQAIMLLKDMANRMSVRNRAEAPSYAITDLVNGSPFFGVGYTGTPNTGDSMANIDLAAWDSSLKGAAETRSGQQIGAMIGARGCISRVGTTDQYVISVAWQGFDQTVAPANACAKNLYGSEAQRRVISLTVQIANLKSL